MIILCFLPSNSKILRNEENNSSYHIITPIDPPWIRKGDTQYVDFPVALVICYIAIVTLW
jgi:hypothetical protein